MRKAPREVPGRRQPFKQTQKSLSWQDLLSRWGSGAHRHIGVSFAPESDHVPGLHLHREDRPRPEAGRYGQAERTLQHGIEQSVRAHRGLLRQLYPHGVDPVLVFGPMARTPRTIFSVVASSSPAGTTLFTSPMR